MTLDALTALLLIPAVAAATAGAAARLPADRAAERAGDAADAAQRGVAVRRRTTSGNYLLVDDLNKVFIVLTTFVGFTTSVFSASYIHQRSRSAG